MSRFGVVVHGGREAAVSGGKHLVALARARGHDVFALSDEAAAIDAEAVASLPSDLDLIFSLGGDGTLLRAFAAQGGSIPILGVNYGRLGFLTASAPEHLETILDAIETDLVVSERLLLEVDGLEPEPLIALNDLIVEKPEPGRAVRLDLSVDGIDFVSWTTDGVIVATPTGSTAYSFSAGGPLIDPELGCLVVTPVSPHGLFDRSIVVAPGRTLTLRLDPEGDGGLASIDGGPARALGPDATLRIRASTQRALLANIGGPGFWDRIREKFGVGHR